MFPDSMSFDWFWPIHHLISLFPRKFYFHMFFTPVFFPDRKKNSSSFFFFKYFFPLLNFTKKIFWTFFPIHKDNKKKFKSTFWDILRKFQKQFLKKKILVSSLSFFLQFTVTRQKGNLYSLAKIFHQSSFYKNIECKKNFPQSGAIWTKNPELSVFMRAWGFCKTLLSPKKKNLRKFVRKFFCFWNFRKTMKFFDHFLFY